MEMLTLVVICLLIAGFFTICMQISGALQCETAMVRFAGLAIIPMIFILVIVIGATFPGRNPSRVTEVKVSMIGNQQVIVFENQENTVQTINLTERYQRVFGPTVKVTEYDRNFWFIKMTHPVTVWRLPRTGLPNSYLLAHRSQIDRSQTLHGARWSGIVRWVSVPCDFIQDPSRSHPMTTNPKPLLTRKQVAAIADMECDCTDPRCKFEESACRTIEAMAELLERTLPFLQSTSVSLYYDINILLSTFNATGGEGAVTTTQTP
jgi:hypothetical protein